MRKMSKRKQAEERELFREGKVGFLLGGTMELELGHQISSMPKVTCPYLPEGVRVSVMNWFMLPDTQTHFTVQFTLDMDHRDDEVLLEFRRRVGTLGRWAMSVDYAEWTDSAFGERAGFMRVDATVHAPMSVGTLKRVLFAEQRAAQRRADKELVAFRIKEFGRAMLRPGRLGVIKDLYKEITEYGKPWSEEEQRRWLMSSGEEDGE